MYLQVTQAAKLLDVTRQWVHELINRGEIGTSTVAGRRFVLDDARFRALRRKRQAEERPRRNGRVRKVFAP